MSDRPDAIGRLGQYDVLELVGRGGMGVVLRAFDPKLNRVVAIKLLAPELAVQPVSVNRFLREARAAAAVSHDHVVSIYAIDDDARPPMIAMEMIDGQSLQQKIDSTGALDVKSILRIGMQTAAGLSAAHRQGLVHRDIKPANILLENGIEKVKLTDFGLARAVDDIGMTKTGQITGTPQYMSPEQAQGQRVDLRTDLFSLGCVLYAMCTGRAAFRADSAVAVLHRIVHDTPRPIREVNEDIPAWLCDIVEKLLAKDPGDRFESAADVEELLGNCLAHLQQPDSVPLPDSVRRPHDLPRIQTMATAADRIRPGRHTAANAASIRRSKKWLWGLLFAGALSVVGITVARLWTDHGAITFQISGSRVTPPRVFLNGARWNGNSSFGFTFRPERSGRFSVAMLRGDNVIREDERRTSRGSEWVLPVASDIDEIHIFGPAYRGKRPQDAAAAKLVSTWEAGSDQAPASVQCLTVSPDERWLVAGLNYSSRSGRFYVWKLQPETTPRSRYGIGGVGTGRVHDVAFSPVDSLRFATVAEHGLAERRLSDAPPTPEILPGRLYTTGKQTLTCLTWTPDGRRIVTGADGRIDVWDVPSHPKQTGNLRARPLATLDLPAGQTDFPSTVTSIACSPDGRFLAVGSDDGRLHLYDATETEPRWLRYLLDASEPRGGAASVAAIQWAPDGRSLVCGILDGTIYCCRIEDDSIVVVTKNSRGDQQGRFQPVAWSRDGSLIATAEPGDTDEHGTVHEWWIALYRPDGQRHRAVHGELHTKTMTSLVFTPDGRHLISASEDGTIKWWEFAEPLVAMNAGRAETTEDDSVRKQIVSLLPEASGIPNSELLELASNLRGPDMDDVSGVPLSIILLLADPSLVPEAKREQAAGEFRYLTEGKPKPADIVRAVSLHQERGYATFLQPEYIKDVTVSVSENSANGTVTFEAPDLFAGKVHYVARRKNGEWRIEEFHLPAYQARIHRDDDGIWQSLRRAVGGDPE